MSPGHPGGGGGGSAGGGFPVADDLERLRRPTLPVFEPDDVDLHVPTPTPKTDEDKKAARKKAKAEKKATIAAALAGAASAALVTGAHKRAKNAEVEPEVDTDAVEPEVEPGVDRRGRRARGVTENPPPARAWTDVPADARDAPWVKLPPVAPDVRSLPVAHGRAKGRICLTCKERRPVSDFISSDGGSKRICRPCREEDAHRVYDRECVVCGKPFESISSKASLCSDECKVVRRAERRAKDDGED